MTAPRLSEGLEALREIEVAWLSEQLSRAIANLGYPVGCGVAPHPEQVKRAATTLFERYASMIEMAGRAQRQRGASR
jgi:hypothetical protein